MSLKFFDKLSQNFLMEKSFTANSNVLKYRSSYFREELESKYVYGEIVNLEKVEIRFIFDLMLLKFGTMIPSGEFLGILISSKINHLTSEISFGYRIKRTFFNYHLQHYGMPACTVVVKKVKGIDEIIGGYNPLA
ncbi:hypothetical protein Glove_428g38 [Diversispora epigaea]|uniref:BTB domain-containing protein n=1 Tax=Diversispora epigaea TaxID=1348612 RepID=A0A397GUJ0_9GLOM|nr:hypothetical protein Glove_428g38 [Diversispora epigaea]